MPFEICPSCAFDQAERSEVLSAATQEPIGTQLFCPRCRFYSPPGGSPAKPAMDPATRAKLKKMGFTDEEIDVLFPQHGPARPGVAIPPKAS